jgi:4-hydroxy-tetrahydrodipicolinate synthase
MEVKVEREELRKLIVGPVAAVATPFDEGFEVDYGRMAEATQFWVENGLVAGKAVIKVAAAMGEGFMLSDDEWPMLVRTVVQAANGKAAIMCGIHYKDTKRAIEHAKKAQDLGVIGVQVPPPMHHAPTQDDMLKYYEALSDAVDIGILIYNNPWYPNGNVLTETLLKMRNFESIVAVKWNTWGSPEGQEYEDMVEFVDTFNVIDNTVSPIRCHQLGGHGFIQTTVDAYPPHDLRIWELAEKGEYEEAEAEYYRVQKPLRELREKFAERSGGEARLKKGMMKLMGMPMGASRPPSQPLSDEEMAELREVVVSFGWPVQG